MTITIMGRKCRPTTLIATKEKQVIEVINLSHNTLLYMTPNTNDDVIKTIQEEVEKEQVEDYRYIGDGNWLAFLKQDKEKIKF